MSRRANILAIIERKSATLDYFIGEVDEWEEVTKAWVQIDPVVLFAQRMEFEDSSQTTSTRKLIVKTEWTPTLAAVDTSCRLKVAKTTPVAPDDLGDDANYRIFHIDQLQNVGEQNRELQLMVVEQAQRA